MKKSFFLILFSFLFPFLFAVAQENRPIKQLYMRSEVSIYTPFMTDSTDRSGKAYDRSTVLQTALTNLPLSSLASCATIVCDTANLFTWGGASEHAKVYLLQIPLQVNTFSTITLRIKTADRAAVYIDQDQRLLKTTVEDSLSQAKDSQQELTLLPGQYMLSIKYLSEPRKAAALSVDWKAKDSLSSIDIIYDSHPQQRPITMTDVLSGIRPTSTSISPNGQYICTGYVQISPNGNKTYYQEIIDRLNGKLLYRHNGSSSMTWFPKSNKLYFTQKEDKTQILYTFDPQTLQSHQLAKDIPEGNIYFSPNERYFILSKTTKEEVSKDDFKQINHPDDRIPGAGNRTALYRYDISSGDCQPLTFGSHSCRIEDISADSRFLLFSCSRERLTQQPFSLHCLYQMDMQTLRVDTVWIEKEWINSAQYSTEVGKLLVLGSPEAFDGIGLNIGKEEKANAFDVQAFHYSMADRKAEALSKSFNPSISRAVCLPHSPHIYFQADDKEYVRIYRYSVKEKKYEALATELDVITSFDIATDSPTAVYISQGVSDYPQAFHYDLRKNKSIRYAHPQAEVQQRLALGKVNEWNFSSKDQTTIYGRYYLPYNFDSTQSYPLIVYYYGGTSPVERTFGSNWNFHYWASQGYVVYVLQPSGATGFGQEFSARHVNAWGKYTANDIIEGTEKFCDAMPFVNRKKIGCIGASYGGFMTQYLQTQTNIFAAAISHAGISDISSYWGEGFWGYGYNSISAAQSYPWNNTKLYTDQSPLTHAHKIQTPLLLLHGMDDTNVPVGESIQMYIALKLLGKEVAFVEIANENHVIADHKRKITWTHTIMAWFAKHLQDQNGWWQSMYK